MPLPRFQKLSPERRAAILEAAALELGTHGYENASLNRVLAAAGVSKGAAYYYFHDKADLFLTVVRHYLTQMRQERPDPATIQRDDFWPLLASRYRTQFRRLRQQRWMSGLARAIWSMRESRGGAPLKPVFDELVDSLRQGIALGQAIGAVRRDLPMDLIVQLFVGVDQAGDQWLLEHWDGLSEVALDAHAARITEVLQRALGEPDVVRQVLDAPAF